MSVPAPTLPAAPPRPPRSTRPVAILAAVVLLIVVVFVALRLTGGGGGADQRVAIPLAGRTTGIIQVDSGADQINITAADTGGDLAVVTTPGGEDGGVVPQARLDGDRLRVWTEDKGDAKDGGQVVIDVKVAQGVLWDVVVDKGARDIKLGLGAGKVHSLELRGGADKVDVNLPKPDGEVALRIPTGLAGVSLHAPAGLPVQIKFGAGAGSAVVDGAQRQGIPAGTTIYGATGRASTNGAKGYKAADDRYLVDIKAGIGNLVLDRSAS